MLGSRPDKCFHLNLTHVRIALKCHRHSKLRLPGVSTSVSGRALVVLMFRR
jgi:hypothetical protein